LIAFVSIVSASTQFAVRQSSRELLYRQFPGTLSLTPALSHSRGRGRLPLSPFVVVSSFLDLPVPGSILDTMRCYRHKGILFARFWMLLCGALLPLTCLRAPGADAGSAFTYQGQLAEAGVAAEGLHELRLGLYDAPTGGNPVGPRLTNLVAVSKGLFTVTPDFGSAAFDGRARFLEIGVRRNGATNDFLTLVPRQPMTPTPYALHAASAEGVPPGAVFIGDGSGLTNAGGFHFADTNWVSTNYPSGLPNPLVGVAVSNAPFVKSKNLLVEDGSITLGPPGWAIMTNYYGIGIINSNFASDNNYPKLAFMTDPGQVANGVGCASIGWSPVHSGEVGGEMHITAPASISINAGYNAANPVVRIQMGASGPVHETISIAPDDNPWFGSRFAGALGQSKILEFYSRYNSNGTVYAAGGLDGPAPWRFGLRQEVVQNNGDVNLMLYSAIPVVEYKPGEQRQDLYYGTNASWRPGYALVRFRTNAVDVTGGPINFSRSTQAAGSICPLDFGRAQCTDISLASESVTFFTTNRAGAATYFESRIFIIHSGSLNANLAWPGWTVVGPTAGTALPTSLSAGQVIRLALESHGPGETNVMASYMIGNDSTFAFAPEAATFFSRANITNATERAAVDVLVKDLKAAGLWASADAIYPFVGGNVQSAAYNLRSANYPITWFGNVVYTNGVQGQGSTGNAYGLTGFHFRNTAGLNYTSNSACLATCLDTVSPQEWTWWAGCGDVPSTGPRVMHLKLNNLFVATPINDAVSDATVLGTLGDFRGVYISSRTDAAQAFTMTKGTVLPVASAAAGVPNGRLGLLGLAHADDTVTDRTDARLTTVWVGGGITADQAQSLTTILTKFNQSLGR